MHYVTENKAELMWLPVYTELFPSLMMLKVKMLKFILERVVKAQRGGVEVYL